MLFRCSILSIVPSLESFWLAFLSPPDDIPFRIILGFFLPHLPEIGFMDGELCFLAECSRTENGRGLGGDWNHGAGCIGKIVPPVEAAIA